jgi:hypothetical protein
MLSVVSGLPVCGEPVPLENRNLVRDLHVSGGQAARRYSFIRPFRTGFWAGPAGVEGRCGAVGSVGLARGSALVDALVGPGRVVVHVVLGQDGAQVRLAQDQHAVQEFAAQRADQ